MEIYVSNKDLRRNLQTVVRSLGRSNYTTVYFDAIRGFSLTSCQLSSPKTTVIVKFRPDEVLVEVEGGRGVLNDVRALWQVVQSLPAKESIQVQITQENNFLVFGFSGPTTEFTYKASIRNETCNKDVTSPIGIYEDEIPEYDQRSSIPGKVLREMIVRARPAIDAKSTSYHPYGLFEVDTDSIALVTTDGHRLAKVYVQSENREFSEESFGFSLDLSVLTQLKFLDNREDTPVEFGVRDGCLCFEGETFIILVQETKSRFPNYRKVVAAAPKKGKFSVNREHFKGVLKRVNGAKCMNVTLTDDEMVVSTISHGEVLTEESLVVSFDASVFDGEIKFGVNPAYVLDYLKTVKSDTIHWYLDDANHQFELMNGQDESKGNWSNYSHSYILMPMRLEV